jgi:hypothetical protein
MTTKFEDILDIVLVKDVDLGDVEMPRRFAQGIRADVEEEQKQRSR